MKKKIKKTAPKKKTPAPVASSAAARGRRLDLKRMRPAVEPNGGRDPREHPTRMREAFVETLTETEADRQALLPGFARSPSSPHAMPDDGHPTVMTIRATKGEVRAWVRAAKSAGFTFPMPWARHVLRTAVQS